MCGGSAWKSCSSSAGSASVRPLCDRLSSCIASAILRLQPLVLDSYPHAGRNLQRQLPDHQHLRGDLLEAFLLEQLDSGLIVVTQAAPDRAGLVLGNVGKATLNEQPPQIGGLGRGHQPQAVGPATAARDQAHPADQLDPLDDEPRLAGPARNAGAEGAGLKA